jgi:L-proline cis-4-hydroxylase
MRTQLLGRVNFGEDDLEPEIQRAAEFRYHEPYTEFLCGRPWKSCMLWAPGGESGDNVIAHYDDTKESSLTEEGRQLPRLFEALGHSFALEHLTFARLAVMSDSVLVPHRDYVEFNNLSARRPSHRLHVPLCTNQQSLFTENDVVFRMKVGEIWSLDVTKLHSAAVLSEQKRMHLILDFRDPSSSGSLLREPSGEAAGIPRRSICSRPVLSDRERDALLSLSSVVDVENLRDVFGVVTKKHYCKDGGADFVWRTMIEIGRRSENKLVDETIRSLHTYYALARAE